MYNSNEIKSQINEINTQLKPIKTILHKIYLNVSSLLFYLK